MSETTEGAIRQSMDLPLERGGLSQGTQSLLAMINLKREIERLQAENAELREKLERARRAFRKIGEVDSYPFRMSTVERWVEEALKDLEGE